MDYENRSNFSINVCKALINGEIVEYDMADTGEFLAPGDCPGWKYIGCGVIYSIMNGVLLDGKIAHHFWQRI